MPTLSVLKTEADRLHDSKSDLLVTLQCPGSAGTHLHGGGMA